MASPLGCPDLGLPLGPLGRRGGSLHEFLPRLAQSLAAAAQHEEAMDVCLALIPKDRHGLGEQARELMVHVFHVLGPQSHVADDYRRKLTMVLY